MKFFLEQVGETGKTEIGKTMIIDRMGTDPSTLLNLPFEKAISSRVPPLLTPKPDSL